MANFKQMPTPPEQLVMFPESIDAAIPTDCDVRLLGEALEALDWRELEASYAATGCPAYPPKALCKILVYGYSKGIRSSRMLEETVKNDRRYIWLAGGLTPDHCTLARFRREKAAWLKDILQRVVRLCAEAGLVLLQVTATDGSRIPARASRRTLYDAKRLAKETAAIEQMLAEVEAVDQAEDAAGGGPTDALPEHLADGRKRKAKLAQIAARLAESERSSVSATEAECRVMKTTQGLRPAYNAQVTVDAEQGVIVAADVIQEETDAGGLAPQLEQVSENLGLRPDVALADTGYCDEGTFQWLAQTGQEALIPPQEHPQDAKRTDLFASRCFDHDAERDVMICPAGQDLTFRHIVQKSNGAYRVYAAAHCRTCSCAAECVTDKKHPNRRLWVSVVAPQREQMRQKLKTPAGRARYRLRQQTVEPVIGHLKWHLRFPRFGLFGLRGARAEFLLLCIAHNLLIYLRKEGSAAHRIAGRQIVRARKEIFSVFHQIRRYCFVFYQCHRRLLQQSAKTPLSPQQRSLAEKNLSAEGLS